MCTKNSSRNGYVNPGMGGCQIRQSLSHGTHGLIVVQIELSC